jgi:hypothetical protein
MVISTDRKGLSDESDRLACDLAVTDKWGE